MKKYIAFDTRKKEKKIIKSSKGLITGAVRGKSILLMLSTQEDIWIKKICKSFSLAFQSKINPFNNLHLLWAIKKVYHFWQNLLEIGWSSMKVKLIRWWMYIKNQILPATQLDMDMLDGTISKDSTGYQSSSIHSSEVVVCNWDVRGKSVL